MEQQQSLLVCPHCSRAGEREVLNCIAESSGGCPFELAEGQSDWNSISSEGKITGYLVTGIPALAVSAALFAIGVLQLTVGLLFVLVIGVTSLVHFLSTLARQTTLTDLDSGQMWLSHRLWGIQFDSTLYTGVREVRVSLPAASLPHLPCSTAALHADTSGVVVAADRIEDAVAMLKLTLAGLVATDQIRLVSARQRVSILGGVA